jgi:hypothetical protein
MSIPAKDTRLAALNQYLRAVAIVFDFVNPVLPLRRRIDGGSKLWLEASELCQLKRKTIRPSKRFITDDTIAVVITAMAAVMDIGPTTVTATAIGHMGIMAMAGDRA